jgi:hypothetical protein
VGGLFEKRLSHTAFYEASVQIAQSGRAFCRTCLLQNAEKHFFAEKNQKNT